MRYKKVKIYNDGGHYIGIPHSKRSKVYRRNPKEELFVIKVNNKQESMQDNTQEHASPAVEFVSAVILDDRNSNELVIDKETGEVLPIESVKIITKREMFEKLYKENLHVYGQTRKDNIINGLKSYFDSLDKAYEYVNENIVRKYKNKISRQVRCERKLNLHEFNYFVTFTFDDNKHTEESFRKKLKTVLWHNSTRKGWKYAGAWERSPENNRLHFHGIFYIPPHAMMGELIEVKDYSTITKRMQLRIQNTFFNEKFGRSDFDKIVDENDVKKAIQYLMKYIEKQGEKIMYSRGMNQYFISDINEDDVVCPIGLEDKKLLLFDSFTCIKDDEVIGTVSKDVIDKMPKSN